MAKAARERKGILRRSVQLDLTSPRCNTAKDVLSSWQIILRRLPAAIWTTNRALKLTSAGGLAACELQAQLERHVDARIDTCFGDANSKAHPTQAHRDALGGSSRTLEFVWQRKAYYLYIEPLYSRTGRIQGCVGLAVDVTPRSHSDSVFEHEIKEIKQSEEVNKALTRVGQRLRKESPDRRDRQAAMQSVQANLFQLAASIESTFWIHDVSADRTVYLSPNYENVWASKIETALKRTGNAITRDAHQADLALIEQADRMQRLGESTCEEFRIVRPDGQLRWIRVRAFPILKKGASVARIAGVAEDITQRREKDEAQRRRERLATVGNFAAGIAHEINNPLGAALAAVQAAARLLQNAGQPVDQCLQTSLAALRQCSHTVKTLLRFCRDEPTTPVRFDLRDVIQQSISLVRGYADEHTTTLTASRLSRALPFLGNPLELEIVMVNLLRNAIQSKATTVTCEVTASKGFIKVSVRDNGQGVADDELKNLCDPFYTSRRSEGGTGLGLSIVHEIVQSHGGVLEFRNNPTGGMTVAFSMPRNTSAGDKAT